ncbi:unnamed protein product [Effrenium voratum]|uniref:PSI domain-containing protein n=1 Tax=Effrenium voratum TaxID=2562239 RepID=A0AA36NAY7_9DINO|nr:unnamed protein product [Effrenium voratum]CAJ1462007.1 unnamed protein product [Effrenium voratum]
MGVGRICWEVLLSLLVAARCQDGEEADVSKVQEVIPLPADHLHQPCLQDCNSSGWCAWCGEKKACCEAGKGPEECVGADAYFQGHKCVSPTQQALEKVGVVDFTFDMDGVYFAAVLAKPDFREHLIEHLKTWVSHLLLYTVQPQHVGVVLSRGDASRTRVSLKVMVPNAGRAGVILAENRFCRASGQAQIRGDAQNFDGLKYGDAESTTWVTMVNRKVAGQPCGQEAHHPWWSRKKLLSLVRPSVWPYVLAGFLAGACATCAVISICYEHCRLKPPKAFARRLPEGGQPVAMPQTAREEAPLLKQCPQAAFPPGAFGGGFCPSGPGGFSPSQNLSSRTYLPAAYMRPP